MSPIERPSWANFIAMDKDGQWNFYDKRPDIAEENGYWYGPFGCKTETVKNCQPSALHWRNSLYEYAESTDTDTRIDLIGQNGNTGEHYDPAATTWHINMPTIYTTVRELRITHDGGYIDVTALADGSVELADNEGGEVRVVSLAVLDAIRNAMARIVGD